MASAQRTPSSSLTRTPALSADLASGSRSSAISSRPWVTQTGKRCPTRPGLASARRTASAASSSASPRCPRDSAILAVVDMMMLVVRWSSPAPSAAARSDAAAPSRSPSEMRAKPAQA